MIELLLCIGFVVSVILVANGLIGFLDERAQLNQERSVIDQMHDELRGQRDYGLENEPTDEIVPPPYYPGMY